MSSEYIATLEAALEVYREKLGRIDGGGKGGHAMSGAIDIQDCPHRGTGKAYSGRRGDCYCKPPCAICGFGPHMAVHGPVYGDVPGGKPFDHEYTPPDCGFDSHPAHLQQAGV